MKRCRLKRYNFQIKTKMSKENKTSDKQDNRNDFIADVSARLYSMKLCERFQHNHLDYFRVPGGWVVVLANGGGSVTSTFVPFDNEFQNVR